MKNFGFYPSWMIGITLSNHTAVDTNHYVMRKNGHTEVIISSEIDKYHRLNSVLIQRLIAIITTHIASGEISNNRVINPFELARAWYKKNGLSFTGGKNGPIRKISEALEILCGLYIQINYGKSSKRTSTLLRLADLACNIDNSKLCRITLSKDFIENIKINSTPVDLSILFCKKNTKHTCFRIDVFLFYSKRVFVINPKCVARIPWTLLSNQFMGSYEEKTKFFEMFLSASNFIRENYYPELRFEWTKKELILKHSPLLVESIENNKFTSGIDANPANYTNTNILANLWNLILRILRIK